MQIDTIVITFLNRNLYIKEKEKYHLISSFRFLSHALSNVHSIYLSFDTFILDKMFASMLFEFSFHNTQTLRSFSIQWYSYSGFFFISKYKTHTITYLYISSLYMCIVLNFRFVCERCSKFLQNRIEWIKFYVQCS